MAPVNRRRTATDAREQPAYGLAEAARYLKLAPATLRSWVLGRPYPTERGLRHFTPLIRPRFGSPGAPVVLEPRRGPRPPSASQ